MPVYTYECKNCGQRFDAKQSFSDAPLNTCPKCGGSVYRIIQPAAVVFKGSGFYVTDSKGKQNLATTNGKKEETKSSEGTEAAAKSDAASDNGATSKSAEKSTEAPAKPAAETKSSDSN